MDADLQQQILAAAPVIEIAHRFPHAECGGERPVGGRKGRHHRVADGLDDGAGLGRDNLVEHAEMGFDQIEGDQIADPLVKLRRAFEVGEQEGQAGDLEPLLDVDRVGPVDVSEDLVGQHPFGGQEWPAPAEQLMKLVSGDP